jgi:ATP-dependent RNA helicase RhlB
VRFMLRRLSPPENRLSMLFSATMAHKVLELAYEHMNQAQLVKIQSESPAVERIEQSVYHPANHEKIPLLVGLMDKFKPDRSIIFANTKHATIRIWEFLQGNGYPAALISGDIPQNKREILLKKFHDGEFAILVATDVASRGLHIPDVTHVFNFDLPELGEDYVHRIGRTARVGKSGYAISFACEDYAMNLMDIETYTERPIPTEAISNDLLAKLKPPVRMKKSRPPQNAGNNSRKGGGRSKQDSRRHKSRNHRTQQQSG